MVVFRSNLRQDVRNVGLAQQLAVLVAVEESVHGCLAFLLSELPRICDSSNVAQEVRDGKAIQCVEAFGCHL